MNREDALREQKEISEWQLKDKGLRPHKYKHLVDRYGMLFSMLSMIDSKDHKLLDLGCRSGGFLEQLLLSGYSVENLYGIDVSDKGIDLAKQERNLKHVFAGDFHQTKFKDDFFDIITASHTFEHSYDIDAAKTEIHRILKPKGYLIALALIPIEGPRGEKYKKNDNDGHYYFWSDPNTFIEVWNDLFDVAMKDINLSPPKENGWVVVGDILFVMQKKDTNEKS